MIAEKLPLGAYMSLLQTTRLTHKLLAPNISHRAALEFLYPSPGGRSAGSYIYRLASVRNIELLENICDRILPRDPNFLWDKCYDWQLKPWYEADLCTCAAMENGRTNPATCTCYSNAMGMDLDLTTWTERELYM